MRIFQLIGLVICLIGLQFGYDAEFTDYENHMLFCSLSMLLNLILIWKNSGLVSTKMICSFLIYSIALVPAIAYYTLGFKLYSYVNFDHQLTDSVTIEMLWIFFLSSNIYTFFLLQKDTPFPDLNEPVVNVTRIPFFFICGLLLVLAYIIDSGSTIINRNYNEIYESRSSLQTLTGVAFAAFFANAYGKARSYLSIGNKQKYRIFWAVSSICIIWLVLHARRTEAIGFISLLLIHQNIITRKTPIKELVIAALALFALYLIGYLRVNALTETNIVQTIIDSLSPTFEGGSSKTEFVNMPSGLGNITASMQTSVYHFFYRGHEFLNGTTIYAYPFKLLPTALVTGLNLADPSTYYYNELVLEQYFYNGGTYLYAPAYGNFGTIGVCIASLLMALLVNFTQKSMRSNNFLLIMMAAIIIFSFIKICWYNFLPLPKTILYNLIMLGYVAFVFKPKRQLSTA